MGDDRQRLGANRGTPSIFEYRRARGIGLASDLDRFLRVLLDAGTRGTYLPEFNFDNGPPISISTEVRPKVGEGFSPVASQFKQFELIYVGGDDRDLRVRTNYRHEKAFFIASKYHPKKRALFSLSTLTGSMTLPTPRVL
jgi:hypothetical protein